MARPEKFTVDYFPHLCKQGKTMYILEARFGNDGYAFWFKLLEILATTRGHYFDASDPIQLEFLGAKTRFPVDKTELILSLLASIDAIDKELWEHKLIWCENLVKNVSEVYSNRKGLLPQKPYFLDGKLQQNIDNHNNNLVNVVNNPISSTDNTQTKVEETKVDKTKLKESRGKETTTLSFQEYIEQELRKEFSDLNLEEELKKFNLYWSEGKRKLQRPKSAFRNWLLKAREFNQEKNGTHKSNIGKVPTVYTKPEELLQ